MTMMVGSDAEVALKREGKYVSAIGLIGGTKEEPKPTEHGWVQEDNVAAEFNIKPASTAEEFADNFEDVLDDLHKIILPIGCVIDITSSAEFPFEELQHPNAMVAGCSPDDDAWVYDTNFPPDLSGTNLRTFGAHVHVSWDFDPEDINERHRMVKAMDLTLGIPSLLLDNDTRRRELYGKAGAHRIKMYGETPGVEWRVASNWWIKARKTIEWTFRNTQRAMELKDELNWDILSSIRDVINTGDKRAAETLINQFEIEMP